MIRPSRVIGRLMTGPAPALLASTALGSTAVSASWMFAGAWSVTVGVNPALTGVGLAASGILGAAVGVMGGRGADRIGLRRGLVLSRLVLGAGILAAIAVALVDQPAAFFVVMAASAANSLAESLEQAMLAAFVTDRGPGTCTEHDGAEAAFGALRVAQNMGYVLGPAIAAILTASGLWSAWLLTCAAFAVGAAVVASRIPRPSRRSNTTVPPPLFAPLRDASFRPFWFLSAGSMVVYLAFQTLTPVWLVGAAGYSPGVWGALAVAGPLLQILVQGSVARWAGRRSRRIAVTGSILVMAVPFGLFAVSASPVVLVIGLVAAVVGDAAWGVVSQANLSRIADRAALGEYFGTYRLTFTVGLTIAPLLGLTMQDAAGDRAMWMTMFAVTLLTAAAATLVLRGDAAPPRSARTKDGQRGS